MYLGIINSPTFSFSGERLNFLDSILRRSPKLDILLAPEYFLSGFNLLDPLAEETTLNQLMEISKKSDTTIFPGTMLVHKEKTSLFSNYCPVFRRGRNIGKIVKMNPILEEKNLNSSLTYSRDSNSPKIDVNGVPVSTEICLDHLLCDPIPESRLHLVPCFGIKNGFRPEKYFGLGGIHYLALADGQDPEKNGLFLINAANGKSAIFPSEEERDGFSIYRFGGLD